MGMVKGGAATGQGLYGFGGGTLAQGMVITNLTKDDYWFGPLRLPGGIGETLIVDDTSATSLYLNDDTVADAIATLAGGPTPKITVTSVASGTLFPRPAGVPQVLHGDGSPQGLTFAAEGSLYLRRDAPTVTSYLYLKTTGISFNTGWTVINPSGVADIPSVRLQRRR